MTDIQTNVLLAPLYHLELIRDRDVPYHQKATTTEEAAQVLHQLSDSSPVETLMVMYLNSSSKIIGVERVGMGGIEEVMARPQEVFRGAIVKAAPELILSHNHPDETVRPSVADIMFTMNIVDLGAMLGLRVRDHIVVGPNNAHMSIRENMKLLSKEFEQARQQSMAAMGGRGLDDIKKRLMDILDPNGRINLPDASKKGGGDPKANASDSDWKESLSYLLLSK